MLDAEKLREDFPLLRESKVIYFDNACTTQKPKQVVDAIVEYYTKYAACAGRSLHKLATKTTEEFEKAREKVAKFINAKKSKEIVWTKNTTEAINLVANSFKFEKGDKVLTTNLEHSSGLLPWQRLAKKGVISLDFVLCNKEGELSIEDFEDKIDEKTKLVSVIFASNVTGTVSPLKEIIKIAHENGALVLADGAQAAPHFPVDVRKLDLDFMGFSAHKMVGPTGIGCLYGKEDLLRELSPFILGGETIKDADLRSYEPEDIPHRLEGGIQNYAGAIGFGAAVDYLTKIGMKNIEDYEKELAKLLIEGLLEVPNLALIGPKDWRKKNALVSFNIKGIEPQDLAIMLDENNIAVRSGMHCAYPFHKFIGENKGSVRASLYFYNTKEEIGIFIEKLKEIAKTLG
ncbi:MAG: cysteine desulfurase [Candidatus Aenigmarchaeota archaeon]|nr:cysteine desulfurase [Candidatus Aenigmarchaeota archaeon]